MLDLLAYIRWKKKLLSPLETTILTSQVGIRGPVPLPTLSSVVVNVTDDVGSNPLRAPTTSLAFLSRMTRPRSVLLELLLVETCVTEEQNHDAK